VDFISLKNVTKTYPTGVTALSGLDLQINKGEFVFIIGASGSGKSTLIRLLYRELKPTSGEILIGGVKVEKLKNRKVYKLRRKLGIVFQDFKLLPKLTAYENVAFALEMYGLPKEEIREKTLKALDLVGLKEKAKSFPDELSGGEQQRVAIARAIVNSPKLLICDEPTGNLDPIMSMEVMRVLEVINELGTTIVVVTHDKEMVNKMKKRVVTLGEGRVKADVEKGSYKE
jgi:cell division transport system ATP-binding protein